MSANEIIAELKSRSAELKEDGVAISDAENIAQKFDEFVELLEKMVSLELMA